MQEGESSPAIQAKGSIYHVENEETEINYHILKAVIAQHPGKGLVKNFILSPA